jgi:uncharacterized membrane protein YfhO
MESIHKASLLEVFIISFFIKVIDIVHEGFMSKNFFDACSN